MKKVIIVSYHFPPYGGKAVQRASKLAKYLPQFGWKPIIFTMPLNEKGVPLDSSLLNELPPDIEIHRPSYKEWRKSIPAFIRKLLFNPLPDRYRWWCDAVSDDLIKLIEHSSADALITTSPTHSVHLLGLEAKKETGIPWIADFRDPWTGHPDFAGKKYRDTLMAMETEVITSADAIVGVVPNILRGFEGKVPSSKLFLIENGYDEDDFKDISNSAGNSNKALMMGYNGTVSDYHDPAPLLKALDSLITSSSIDTKDIRVLFTTSEGGKKRFAPFAHLMKSGIVEVHGYLPHRESLEQLSKMDVLLLLTTKGRDIYTGKLFEYLYLGHPILALGTPDDDLDILLRELRAGVVTDYRDISAVKNTLLNFVEKKKQGSLTRLPRGRSEIQRFSRRNIAQRYAELLDTFTAGADAVSLFHKQGR